VLLGVGGGIAAYKSADLVRRLRERGAEVRVVMTGSATRFVAPATFQAVSGQPVRTSLWDEAAEAAMGHIELARWADRVLVAPATADLLARLAHGLADDLLTTLCLATEAPLFLAPAMNRAMWAHPATRANLDLLVARGATVLGPASGDQACGEVGEGRMLEPAELAGRVLAPPALLLAGRRVLVTAGPTYEDIDPVRFIGNRSSGRMGFAVAAAAVAMGARVQLVAGPCALPTPPGVVRTDVRSAAEMHQVVLAALPGQDLFVAAAAVADFTPARVAAHKLKKDGGAPALALLPTPDILADVAARAERPFVLGFAAETEALEANARAKLERKRLDMIAANAVGDGQGFDREDNALLVLWPGGSATLERAPKPVLATRLLALAAERMQATEDGCAKSN